MDGHTWLPGDAISLADLLLAPHLSMSAQALEGAEILREHKHLESWLARIEARPSIAATTWDRLLERVAASAQLAALNNTHQGFGTVCWCGQT